MARPRLRWDIRQASRQILAVFLSLLAVNAAVYFILVRPRLAEYRALNSADERRIAELTRRERAVTLREEYLRSLQQAEEDLGRLRTEVLQTRDRRMISVQEELDRLVRQFNVNVEQITYQNELLPDEGVERFAMNVPLEGGYANLRRFIHAVESSPEFLVVERVALGEGDEGGVVLQLHIELATYFDLPEFDRDRRKGGRGARRA